MSEHIQTVTDSAFDTTVLTANKPFLIDFWAEWCGPCRALSPILAEVANTYKDKIFIGKMNIDENPQTPAKYGVMSIPTLILFQNGQVVAMKMGLLSKSELSAFIDSHL